MICVDPTRCGLVRSELLLIFLVTNYLNNSGVQYSVVTSIFPSSYLLGSTPSDIQDPTFDEGIKASGILRKIRLLRTKGTHTKPEGPGGVDHNLHSTPPNEHTERGLT